MKTFREMAEVIKKLGDEAMDSVIKNDWGGSVLTYKFNATAVMELAKIFPNILVTKDRRFFHLPGTQNTKQTQEASKILIKYKLKEV